MFLVVVVVVVVIEFDVVDVAVDTHAQLRALKPTLTCTDTHTHTRTHTHTHTHTLARTHAVNVPIMPQFQRQIIWIRFYNVYGKNIPLYLSSVLETDNSDVSRKC